jgi:hypothetical protein
MDDGPAFPPLRIFKTSKCKQYILEQAACSVGWWLMAGAGSFWEKSTAGWLLVAGLLWEKSTAGWWLISQANRGQEECVQAGTADHYRYRRIDLSLVIKAVQNGAIRHHDPVTPSASVYNWQFWVKMRFKIFSFERWSEQIFSFKTKLVQEATRASGLACHVRQPRVDPPFLPALLSLCLTIFPSLISLPAVINHSLRRLSPFSLLTDSASRRPEPSTPPR